MFSGFLNRLHMEHGGALGEICNTLRGVWGDAKRVAGVLERTPDFRIDKKGCLVLAALYF